MSEDATLDKFLEDEGGKKEDSEWNESKLDELLSELLTGGRPTGGGLDDGEYISIGGTQVDSSGYIDLHDLVYIPEDYFEQVEETQLQKHDILMVKDGANTGDVAIAWGSDDRIVTNEHLFTLRANPSINSPYLFYFLLSHQGWKQINGTITGSAQEGINRGFTGKIDIKYPSLSQQRKIATVLHTVDRAIGKVEEIREQTERVRAGTAQDLFRNGISNKKTKETWLGEIPEDWDVVQFSEIVDSNRNGLYKSTDAYGEGCPIAKMGNALEKRTLDMSSADRLELTDKEKEKYGLKKGDLIFARRAQEVSAAGDCCYVPQLDELTVFESSLIRVRLSEEANPRFYTQYFDSPVGSRSIERIVTETSISGIATSDLLDLKVAVPNPDEQSEIASIMWQFDRQEKALHREREQYERLKRGLMQDLLSGTVRTTDTNIEVPDEIAQYG